MMMNIRTRAALAIALPLASLVLLSARPAAAQNREHQQMMADLRMLQEQTSQLQVLMDTLGQALQAVTAKLDDQTSLERKAFADSKVQMDAMSGDIRIVREKVDETNVRLGSLAQELEALRMAIPEPGIPVAPTTDSADAGSAQPPQADAMPMPAPPRVQPQQLFAQSYGDYTTGNYSLAVQGFQSYLSYFPKSERAHEAQLNIGEALYQDKKLDEAVTAYDRVIANYPQSPSVPLAYYKRGLALEQLNERDRARASYEEVVKLFPETDAAILAKQRLERWNQPAR